jgi:hypothetical protein
MIHPPPPFHEGADIVAGQRVWSRYYLSLDAASQASDAYNGSAPLETTPGRIWRVDVAEGPAV